MKKLTQILYDGYGQIAPESIPGQGATKFPSVAGTASDIYEPDYKFGSGDIPNSSDTIWKKKKRIDINEIGKIPLDPFEFNHEYSTSDKHIFTFYSKKTNTKYVTKFEKCYSLCDIVGKVVYSIQFKVNDGSFTDITNNSETLKVLSTVNDIIVFSNSDLNVKHITFRASNKSNGRNKRKSIYLNYFKNRNPKWKIDYIEDSGDSYNVITI